MVLFLDIPLQFALINRERELYYHLWVEIKLDYKESCFDEYLKVQGLSNLLIRVFEIKAQLNP